MTNDLDQRIAALSPAKRRLLEQRLASLESVRRHDAHVERRNPNEPVPLSYSQQRFWFIHELEPDLPVYNVTRAARVRGALDVSALERSLATLIARHAALRTVFRTDASGQVWQHILENVHFQMPVIDLQSDPDREQRLEHYLVRDARQRFDLTRDPTLRATLYVLGESDYVYCEVHHHIATDFWSSGILHRELSECYAAFRDGRSPSLPELPLEYADFAVWQRRQEKTDEFQQQLGYWRSKLAAPLPALDLPEDRSRSAVQQRHGSGVNALLAEDVADGLRRLGRSQGATLFMSLTTALVALLHRYSGQRDMVFGALSAGRSRVELEHLVGCFINTLVFRVDLSGEPTFADLLRRVRDVALEAFANQDVPFERVVAEVQPDRSPTGDPIVTLMLDFLNAPGADWRLPDLEWTPIEVRRGTAEYDILVMVRPRGETLEVGLRYNAALFSADMMHRMLGHLQVLVKAAAANPEQPIGQLPYLTGAERTHILVDWNLTAQPFDLEHGAYDLFAEQAQRFPDAQAASDASVTVTYAELLGRVDRLARGLADAGAVWADPSAPQPIMAVLANRSVDFVATMLAIFKAGGIYLPLDPRAPVARQRQVLDESKAEYLIVESSLAHLVPEVGANSLLHVVTVDGLMGTPDHDRWVQVPNHPRQLAYVIFTSGSTGAPKGAMVEQRGMVNHLWVKVNTLAMIGADRVAQTAPQVFDISVWQFLSPLIVGGSVHVFADEVAFNPTAILDAVDAAHITVFETVPSLMTAMLDHLKSGAGRPDLKHLRWLIPTGEALPASLSRAWFDLYPGVRQMNAYGPTECSDDVTQYALTQPQAGDSQTVSIGRPVANLRIYILDPQLQPVAVGIVGEVYVTGAGVGRGYLHDPALTAATFLPDPFSDVPGERLYRTGDLGRYLPDGSIEFLGRKDHQVKVRGMRIELGEIEATLKNAPGVIEAVVLVSSGDVGTARLVAFVTGRDVSKIVGSEITAFAAERLPYYMVPGAIVVLDFLPHTASGKIDRHALAKYDFGPRESIPDFEPPATPTELAITSIWSELLGGKAIGVRDNFFELGGHSLLAAQVVVRLRESLASDLPLARFFEFPTVAGLSEYLTAGELTPGRTEKLASIYLRIRAMSDDALGLALEDSGSLAQRRESD